MLVRSIATRTSSSAIQNCINRSTIKSTAVNSRDIVVLECRLCVVGENTTIDSHCGTIIIFHSINAASKCTAFNRQGRIIDTIFRLTVIKISIFKQAGIAALIIHGDISNRHSAMIQESVIGVAILSTIFLATVVGATVQRNCTDIVYSNLTMRYIINSAFITVNRQSALIENGMAINIGQLMTSQVNRQHLISRNDNILCGIFKQGNSIIVSRRNSLRQRLIIGVANLCNCNVFQRLNSVSIIFILLCIVILFAILRNIRGECTALQLDVVGCRVVCRICRIGCIKINALCCIHIKFLIANTALCRTSASKCTTVYSYLSCSCNDTNTIINSKITTVYSNNILPRSINSASNIASRFNIARKRTTVDGNYIGITISWGAITRNYRIIQCRKYAVFNGDRCIRSIAGNNRAFLCLNISILNGCYRIAAYTYTYITRRFNYTVLLLRRISNNQSTIIQNSSRTTGNLMTIQVQCNI